MTAAQQAQQQNRTRDGRYNFGNGQPTATEADITFDVPNDDTVSINDLHRQLSEIYTSREIWSALNTRRTETGTYDAEEVAQIKKELRSMSGVANDSTDRPDFEPFIFSQVTFTKDQVPAGSKAHIGNGRWARRSPFNGTLYINDGVLHDPAYEKHMRDNGVPSVGMLGGGDPDEIDAFRMKLRRNLLMNPLITADRRTLRHASAQQLATAEGLIMLNRQWDRDNPNKYTKELQAIYDERQRVQASWSEWDNDDMRREAEASLGITTDEQDQA